MDALDRIRRAHIQVMGHKQWCEYSGVLACGEVKITKDLPTAATDGWDVFYNPDFLDPLSDAQVRFLVLHEATHKAYRHLTIYQDLQAVDRRLTNIALDMFINLALVDADAAYASTPWILMPPGGVSPDPKYRGWSSRQIFNDLLQNASKQPQQGFDEHDWEGAKGEGDGDGEGEGEGEGEGAKAARRLKAAAIETKRAEEIQRAMQQGADLKRKRSPDGAGGADGVFGDLLTPRTPWRDVTRDFCMTHVAGRDESSWRRVNRRYLAGGVYMPGMQGVTIEELVVGFDTSGSCFGSAEMTVFVSELASLMDMLKPAKCHVIYWDTQVAGHQVFEDGQFAVQDLKPKGGGGTDGAVLFDYLREKNINPAAVVQFTDGYVGAWGTSGWPTLWAIKGTAVAPFGVTINLDESR